MQLPAVFNGAYSVKILIGMVPKETEEIRCEIVPIPGASAVSKHALFFHRLSEQDTDSCHHSDLPSCSIHHDKVAAIQCIDCVKYGLPVKQSYHCSNKCFLNAWRKHLLNHILTTNNHSFNGNVETLGKLKRCNSWPPGDMVSWFDERVEVVFPRGKKWVKRLGSTNISVPLAGGVGFSVRLGPEVQAHLEGPLSAKDVLVTDPTTRRSNLSSRCVIRLEDIKKSEKCDITGKLSTVGGFSVLTYNLLSDIYASPEKYFYCPEWALTWEYRRSNLLYEIIQYDADILCLQEVQSDHFDNFFKPELAKFGYSATYKKKTKEVFTGNGYTIDGCAIFFRNDLFKEVIVYELEYSKTAASLIEKLELSQRDQASIRLIKDNVALAIILEMVGDASVHSASWSRLCVVNTHIYASKTSPDVKLLQVSCLTNEIERIIDRRIPLLICGDLNSIPGSDPYVLLANNEVNPACGKKSSDPVGINQHLKLHHSMNLASAYTSAFLKPVNDMEGLRMDPKTGEPLFTCLTVNHRSTLDYIFYTGSYSTSNQGYTEAVSLFVYTGVRLRTIDPRPRPRGETTLGCCCCCCCFVLLVYKKKTYLYAVDSLEVEGLLELPDYDSLDKALPSPLWSSDHISLLASFRITRPFLQEQDALPLSLQDAHAGMFPML